MENDELLAAESVTEEIAEKADVARDIDLSDAFLLMAGEIKGLRTVIEQSYVSAREAAERDQRSKRRSQWAILGATLAILLSAMGSFFAARASYGNNNVIERFDECVNPSDSEDPHECYEDSQERLQNAIQALLDGHESRNQRLVDAFNEFFHQVDPTLPDVILEHPDDNNSG